MEDKRYEENVASSRQLELFQTLLQRRKRVKVDFVHIGSVSVNDGVACDENIMVGNGLLFFGKVSVEVTYHISLHDDGRQITLHAETGCLYKIVITMGDQETTTNLYTALINANRVCHDGREELELMHTYCLNRYTSDEFANSNIFVESANPDFIFTLNIFSLQIQQMIREKRHERDILRNFKIALNIKEQRF